MTGHTRRIFHWPGGTIRVPVLLSFSRRLTAVTYTLAYGETIATARFTKAVDRVGPRAVNRTVCYPINGGIEISDMSRINRVTWPTQKIHLQPLPHNCHSKTFSSLIKHALPT